MDIPQSWGPLLETWLDVAHEKMIACVEHDLSGYALVILED